MSTSSSRAPAPMDLVDTLARDLAGATLIERAIVVRGDEEYFARRVQDLVVERAKQLDYEVIVRNGEDTSTDATDLMGELATPPMFAPRQLFVLRGFDAKLRTVGKEVPPLVSALLAFLARSEPERAVLLRAESMRADHRLAKAAMRQIAVRRLYDSPPPWKPDPMATELVQWVRRRAKELGVALEPRSVLYVAAATGSDLAAIDVQLERLKVSGNAAVRDVVDWQATGTPWEVADQFFAGDAARSIAAVVGLFAGGMVDKDGRRVTDPDALSAMLVGALVRTVRQGHSIADARAAGESAERALEIGGASGPRAVETWKARMSVRARPQEWTAMLEDTTELERTARRGGGLSVDHFVALALRWRKDGAVVTRRTDA